MKHLENGKFYSTNLLIEQIINSPGKFLAIKTLIKQDINLLEDVKSFIKNKYPNSLKYIKVLPQSKTNEVFIYVNENSKDWHKALGRHIKEKNINCKLNKSGKLLYFTELKPSSELDPDWC